MSGNLRVLILNERDTWHPNAGGAEIHIAEIFRRLIDRDFEVTLASSSFPDARARDNLDGMRIERLGALPFYYPRAARFCARQTRRGRFDVVVECLNKLPFYAPVYSSAPVVALCHHLFGKAAFAQKPWPIAATVWAAERMIPIFYRRTPFVSISASTRDDLVARGIRAGSIQVIHCGTNGVQRAPHAPSVRGPRIAYLGRLEAYKRVDVLLRAAAKLTARFPELDVVVAGRGADRSRLEKMAADLGISDRTRFCGYVSDAERDRILGSVRVCVCPSVKEGFGLTVLESSALGTPVVATDAPGLRDSVIHGRTGFLVAGGNVDAFAERIGALLSDDDLADSLSRAGLDWAQHFDWERSANAMARSLQTAR